MWNEMSNPAVLVKIGQRIKETRIRQHITQEDRCEHREGQIGIAAVVHQCTSFTRPFGEPGTTGTGNPDQPDRTQKTAREKTLPCTPFKTR